MFLALGFGTLYMENWLAKALSNTSKSLKLVKRVVRSLDERVY